MQLNLSTCYAMQMMMFVFHLAQEVYTNYEIVPVMFNSRLPCSAHIFRNVHKTFRDTAHSCAVSNKRKCKLLFPVQFYKCSGR